jgi:hypothetical protein
MKKLLTFASVALLGMALVSSCSKSSSSPSYKMSASVAGTSYSAGNCIESSSTGYVVITGISGSALTPTPPYIILWVKSASLATGTFNFDTTMVSSFAEYYASTSTFKLSKTGSVTITSISPSVVGTFSFTSTDGTAVTNGAFTAKIQ